MLENIVIFLICVLSGVFTGLLGIGGGLIIVPMFMTVLPWFNIDTLSVHQIVGISTTCVFLNSATTLFYRRKEEFIDKKMLVTLSLFIVVGTILGSFLSSFSPEKLISIVYIFVVCISLYLFNKSVFVDMTKSKYAFLLYLIFSLIGALSSIIGIGGAVFFATALKCFIDSDTKGLLPSLTFLVCIHAAFAFLSKLFLGEVVLFIIPIAICASIIGAKIGVKISKKLSSPTLNIMFQVVLILGLFRMVFELFKS